MPRTYQKTELGPFTGMNLAPGAKGQSELVYAANAYIGPEGLNKRYGYSRLGGPVNSLKPVNGLCQYRLPAGNIAVSGSRLLIAGADDTTAPDAGGYVAKWDASSSAWSRLNSSVSYSTDVKARYSFVTVNGKLFLCNQYSTLLKYYPDDATAFEAIVPKDGYPGDATHPCYTSIPIPHMLGTYDGRIIIGNFASGSGPYRTTQGADTYIDKYGPRTVWLSEALTDFNSDVVFQAKEYFIFQTNDEQFVVAQHEYKDQNLFWLTDSLWILLGDTGGNFKATPVSQETGCVASGSVCETPIGMIFLARDGFYLYDGVASPKKISEDIDRIFTQFYGSYDLGAIVMDHNNADLATARYNTVRGTYECWIPMLNFDGNHIGLAYNLNTQGWTLLGQGTYLDTSTGYITTAEHGIAATTAIMYEDETNMIFGCHADADGFVNGESNSQKDAYIELTGTSGSAATYAMIATGTYSSGTTSFSTAGAILEVLDDRTTTERADGTATPAGRIPAGTQRMITASAVAVAEGYPYKVTFAALPYAPQNGCLLAVYWPICYRTINEIYTKDQQTVKKLHRFIDRIRGTNRNSANIVSVVGGSDTYAGTYAVWYSGNPSRMKVDQSITALGAGAVAQGTSYVPIRNEENYAKIDVRVNCNGSNLVGRKFAVIHEEFSCEPFAHDGSTIEHGVLGQY